MLTMLTRNRVSFRCTSFWQGGRVPPELQVGQWYRWRARKILASLVGTDAALAPGLLFNQQMGLLRQLSSSCPKGKTRFEGAEYKGRTPIVLKALVRFLALSPAGKAYDGFVLHGQASREDAMMWAAKSAVSSIMRGYSALVRWCPSSAASAISSAAGLPTSSASMTMR
jgi:hypothetical protein